MPSAAQYLFTTGEGLALLALFAGSPIVLALMSIQSIRPRHVVVHGGLAVVFGIMAAITLSQVMPGSGMGGLIFILAGAGTGLLAIAFLFGALSTGLIVLLRRGGQSPPPRARLPPTRQSPSARPRLKEFALWKAHSRRPHATYQEFLDEAHPRYFSPSALSIAAAVVAMVVVGYLLTR